MAWLGLNHKGLSNVSVSPLDDVDPPFITSTRVINQLTAHDVSVNSRSLEDFFSHIRVRVPCDSSSFVIVDPEMLFHPNQWSEAGISSPVLWLDGPPSETEDFNNPLTMIAAKFVDVASRSNIPIISYFCQLSRENPTAHGHTMETRALIALLYALVRQMVELLLPGLETTVDLSESRFRQLDGSLETWDDALSIFKDLTELIPEGVLCVIDGLHWMDDRSTDKYLMDLVQKLRTGRMKVIFVTTGRSACLREQLSRVETVQIESLQPRLLTEVADMPTLLAV